MELDFYTRRRDFKESGSRCVLIDSQKVRMSGNALDDLVILAVWRVNVAKKPAHRREGSGHCERSEAIHPGFGLLRRFASRNDEIRDTD